MFVFSHFPSNTAAQFMLRVQHNRCAYVLERVGQQTSFNLTAFLYVSYAGVFCIISFEWSGRVDLLWREGL